MKRPQLFGKTLFADLLLSTLVMILGINMVSEVKRDQKDKEEKALATDGQYAVVMTWPDKGCDDVDLYVRDPLGNIAFFSGRDVGLMNHTYDDRGCLTDNMRTNGGGTVTVDKNEERIIIRGTVRGEYIANAHMFKKNDRDPIDVTLKLYRLKGDDTELISKTVHLVQSGDEATGFRFSLDDYGALVGQTDLQIKLIGNARQQGPRGSGTPSAEPTGEEEYE